MGGRLVLIVALITGVSLVASVALLPLVVPAGGLARDTANKLGDVPPLEKALPDPAQRSVIYAADGKTALATIWLDENRRVVPLSGIPKRVRNAVIAIEDDRFYQHKGVDFRGIARAAVTDLRSGHIAQGGSTLTQQLVKLTVTGNSRTIDRKLREAMYAVELERTYSKNKILEYYLNQAYFGEGVYGIATAAQHYFGNTSIKFVSLAQAASLAATIAAPERYKPTSKKSNLDRRNLVLDRMQELGYATGKEVARAKKEKLRIKLYTPPRRQPYFERYIVDQLLNDPSYNKALGKVGSDERKRKVFQGGLRIHTTLQSPKQAMAARAVGGPMDQFRGDPAGALASVEPSTGRIVALYGGKSFKKSQVDLATAKGGSGFQPGSTMKMFFVVAALEKGISPGLTMAGPARITIPDRRCYTGNGPWSPGNAGDSSAGVYNMYGATAGSVNTWFAQLAVKVGPERALEVARKMGISNVPPRGSKEYASWNVCSLVLGVKEVSPLDMAGAFGVLANKGVRCAPYSITKVVAPGERKPLIENKPECKRVIDEKISTRTVAMLRGVITGGTGRRAALGARPVAGKTGSAQDNLSAFFSGFTPQLSTSVWVGFRARRVPMRSQFQGGPVYGGTFPALIFHNYMEAALAGQPIVGFPAAPPPPAPPALGVPDVVGLSQGEAQAILSRAGFRVSARQVPSAQPQGRVVRQGPRAGTKLRQGSTVYLAVSGGRNGGNGVVPGVVGLQVSVARALLTRAGFSSGLAYTNRGQPGRVAAQSPAAGTQLPKGSYITLLVRRS
ncbi:MAG TPA: transglycosylase domain-containing protein [Actinomycetota bacterium]